MTRKSRDDLLDDAGTNLPDNTSGQISPADVRGAVQDIVDSSFNLESDTSDDVPEGEVNLYATPASVEAAGAVMYADNAIRERLTAARTYYVRKDGSDSNDGMTNNSGGAFLTIAKAVAVAYTIDLGIYDLTIVVGRGGGAGVFSEVVRFESAFLGSGVVRLEGDDTDATAVSLTGSTAVIVSGGAAVRLNHLTVAGTSIGVSVRTGGRCTLGANLVFGASTNYHVEANYGGFLIGGDYKIVGNAGRHIRMEGGMCQYAANAITLEGALSISTFIEVVGGGFGSFYATTWTGGTITGKRYSASANSVIQVYGGGANVFPGSTAGDVVTGGQYI